MTGQYTTDKEPCAIITSVMAAHGVREAVVSPGSRNAPMIVAIDRCPQISATVIIDERSAAFIALGKALVSRRPVAIVCTSGTALLNYAPAVAEAYYRGVPLVVISADRPAEWIDQDDSQTIRQPEALSHYVKRSYDIPSRCSDDTARWYVNRLANDAMLACSSARPAPVHINVQLEAPLNGLADTLPTRWASRTISICRPEASLSEAQAMELARRIASPAKVLVVAGFHSPDHKLEQAIDRLSHHPGVTVMAETLANLHSPRFIHDIDATISAMTEEMTEEMQPDIVITIGGAIVSRMIKQFLRSAPGCLHWQVGVTETTVDCFMHLDMRIDMPAPSCLDTLSLALDTIEPAESIADGGNSYSAKWHSIATRARDIHRRFADGCAWTTLTAMRHIMANIPDGWALQLSNGTSVRYAQLFPALQTARADCNRGCSGIDGCTSTAVGASTAFEGTTLLVSGDMSALYDIGALQAIPCLSPRFKMIVMCNGGGEIFRFVGNTSTLPQRDEYFVAKRPAPFARLADAFGFAYYEAGSAETLAEEFPRFVAETARPAILALTTPGEESAAALRAYLSQKLC